MRQSANLKVLYNRSFTLRDIWIGIYCKRAPKIYTFFHEELVNKADSLFFFNIKKHGLKVLNARHDLDLTALTVSASCHPRIWCCSPSWWPPAAPPGSRPGRRGGTDRPWPTNSIELIHRILEVYGMSGSQTVCEKRSSLLFSHGIITATQNSETESKGTFCLRWRSLSP